VKFKRLVHSINGWKGTFSTVLKEIAKTVTQITRKSLSMKNLLQLRTAFANELNLIKEVPVIKGLNALRLSLKRYNIK